MTLSMREGDRFDPVLLRHPPLAQDALERGESAESDDLLTPAAQNSFADRFQRFDRAQSRYALAGNWYVTLADGLHEVLSVVREMQDAPPEQRRAFLAEPHARIKARLDDRVDPAIIDELFEETPAFLSARVQCLGEWSPKLHAFVPEGTTAWLPPDEIGGKGPGRGEKAQTKLRSPCRRDGIVRGRGRTFRTDPGLRERVKEASLP